MIASLITDAGQVNGEWLEAVLRRAGLLSSSQGRIATFARTVSQPFLATMVQIEVSYSPAVEVAADVPTRFLLKIDGPDTQDGGKEVEFYTRYGTRLAALPVPPTVRCIDAVYDEARRAYHLLLPDLSETHYSIEREAPPTVAEAERMIDVLAALHAAWWDRLDASVALIDADLLTGTTTFFAPFVDFMGERLTPERCHIYERILSKLPTLLNARLQQGVTLVHDDAHAWNFLHPRTPQTQPTVLIDWQQWGRSVGAHDVAYLISLFWYPDHRSRQEQAMLRHYHARLLEYGVTGYSFDACWTDYRLYVLRNMLVPLWAFQWGHWAAHRWMQMEKGWFAFNDLGCAELLD